MTEQTKPEAPTLYRHGDVLIATVDEIPNNATRRENLTLAYGEVTGHSHRIADPSTAETFSHEGLLYLRVVGESAALVHEEHNTINLPKGTYRVWMQREYSPEAIRRVID